MAETNEDVEDTPEQWTAKQAAIALLPALPTTEEEPPTEAPFVVTKEYRRIAEFADAVRRERYIGLCYGPTGVGQTLSARRYARWDLVEPAVQHFKFFHTHNVPREILDTRSAVYTPKVHNSPGRLDKELAFVQDRLSWAIQTLEHPEHEPPDLTRHQGRYAELLIVDEADRLKTPTLEQLRDRHDRTGVGLILIGMPGIEKRLARYPQLYSRVGFVHHFRVLSAEEQAFVLARHWPELGLHDPNDFTTAEALATIIRITSGNFRLTARLVAQIKRVLDINQLTVVTKEVIEAARESLVIGVLGPPSATPAPAPATTPPRSGPSSPLPAASPSTATSRSPCAPTGPSSTARSPHWRPAAPSSCAASSTSAGPWNTWPTCSPPSTAVAYGSGPCTNSSTPPNTENCSGRSPTALSTLAERARLVAYDRAGFGRSGRTDEQPGIDDMASDLAGMVEAVVPDELVLVAHSMGGLVARRAAETLAPRLKGLLLVDPTPETAPVYDVLDQTTKKIDRALAVAQVLCRFRPLRRLASGNVRRLFSRDTYEAMLAEDFVPDGIAQTRKEARAVAAAVPQFRSRPPRPPQCPTILLSATRPRKGRERQHADIREHQRSYAESLPDGRFESADSAHFIQAEQPQLVAERVRQLLGLPA
jgi:DNA transposition AAA+ family ATPase/pimeloyl-ACP methyl ester carboxylesterase